MISLLRHSIDETSTTDDDDAGIMHEMYGTKTTTDLLPAMLVKVVRVLSLINVHSGALATRDGDVSCAHACCSLQELPWNVSRRRLGACHVIEDWDRDISR